jgi:hypothetical protein
MAGQAPLASPHGAVAGSEDLLSASTFVNMFNILTGFILIRSFMSVRDQISLMLCISSITNDSFSYLQDRHTGDFPCPA